MHEFKYKGNQLCCENVSVERIADRFQTPFYLYSYRTLIDHYAKIESAFASAKPLICFSVKANSNLAIMRALVKRGAGLDVVSGGELYKARKTGINPKKIVYAGVGKTEKEIREAIRADILFFNVESEGELRLIDRVAARYDRVVNVALRINPNIRPRTHRYITTGAKETKFGLSLNAIADIFKRRYQYRNVSINGLHMHIGSQIVEAEPFIAAIKKALSFIKKHPLNITWLNIGGGLGIIYSKERPQTAQEFAEKVLPLIRGRHLKLILEPGRFIAGNSGILVTKVLYVKETAARKFIVVDAGMNDFIRPSIYGAYHEILPVRRTGSAQRRARYDIVGPICESGDFLGKDRMLNTPKEGDLFAVMGTGAYGFSMSSNYNARPRIAEVMVINGRTRLIRRPQNYTDLVRGEVIPVALK